MRRLIENRNYALRIIDISLELQSSYLQHDSDTVVSSVSSVSGRRFRVSVSSFKSGSRFPVQVAP
jgi:hypothetical protein